MQYEAIMYLTIFCVIIYLFGTRINKLVDLKYNGGKCYMCDSPLTKSSVTRNGSRVYKCTNCNTSIVIKGSIDRDFKEYCPPEEPESPPIPYIYLVIGLKDIDDVNDSTRKCFGFFDDIAECAHDIVSDLHDEAYKYVVVEKIEEGLYSKISDREWWQYVDGKYIEIKCPRRAMFNKSYIIG